MNIKKGKDKIMLRFILTGGTIDSYYDTDACTTVVYKNSVIPEYLEKTVLMDMDKISFSHLCMKDSREINEDDRKEILKIIEESSENKFIITHGTYTMFETARYIDKHLKRSDVTVTVIGALIPLLGFSPTDAGVSLGCAINNSFNCSNKGVYIYIKGRRYKSDEEVVLHT